MKTDDSMINVLPSRDRKRSAWSVGAVAVLAALLLAACTSDPGARRVAQDIIKAEAIENPDLNEDCMLAALEEFSDSELEDITQQLDSANEGTRAEGQVALDEFEAALAACN